MTGDLLETASALVERAAPGEALEAFLTHSREFQVKAYLGEVESIASSEPRGAGVRLVSQERPGFAFTTDLTPGGLDEVVAAARANAAHATPDPAVVLPAARGEPDAVDGLVDAAQSGVDVAAKVSFARELDETTRTLDERVRSVEESVYADSDTLMAIASTEGIAATYRRTDAWCYTLAIAEADGDTEVGFEFGLAGGLAGLDLRRVAEVAVRKATSVLGATKIPSQRLPVIFDPYTAGQFLGVLGSALTGEAVQKGRSLFAGRLGQAVAAPRVSLVDDGRVPGAPGSAPWDAEGVPTLRTEVISAGVLVSFLYDTVSARREGVASTGNASRAGFKSAPSPSPSNLAFEPTGESSDEILRAADRAFLVESLHGVHSGANAISGDFSVGATGRLVERGEPSAPVKEVTIAAPMLEILRLTVAVGPDRRWLPFAGSFGGATTLVEEMTIAGL